MAVVGGSRHKTGRKWLEQVESGEVRSADKSSYSDRLVLVACPTICIFLRVLVPRYLSQEIIFWDSPRSLPPPFRGGAGSESFSHALRSSIADRRLYQPFHEHRHIFIDDGRGFPRCFE